MKTTKEFFEKLQQDEAFAQEVMTKIQEKQKDGTEDYKALWIPLAAEYGYELKSEELDEMYEKAAAEMSDEDLGKVAGGTSPVCLYLSILIVSASVSAPVSYYTNK